MNRWAKNLEIIRLMILEEYRLHAAMIGKFQFLFFSVLIAIFSFVISTSSASLLQTMPMDRIYFILHILILAYGLSVGAFALFGEQIAERRFGQIDLMLTTPLTHPVDFKTIFLAFYIKDAIYYILLTIVPIIAGIGMSIPITSFKVTSVLFLSLTITLSFLLGISFSFFLSSIYVRYRSLFVAISAALLMAVTLGFSTELYDLEELIPSLTFQYTKNPIYLGACVVMILIFSIIATEFIKIEFGKKAQKYSTEITSIKERLGFMKGYSTYIAKEWIDIKRSRTLYPIIGAYIGPLIFLAFIMWFLRTVLLLPINFGIVFYAAMIGFFGMTIYSWLNVIDTPDFYQLLPVTVPRLIMTKLLLFFLFSYTISSAFLVVLGIANSELNFLFLALIVAFTTTSYTVIVTAYLTGLRTNVYLFDPRILGKFAAMVIPPLVVIAIASSRLSESSGTLGLLILGVCSLLIFGMVMMYRGIEKRWGRETFVV
ncbi:MAG: hypothetical protein SVM80_10980 [Halobacteriota archaeon]|nr:hypothetical protein [Halobacteriota archaeon]